MLPALILAGLLGAVGTADSECATPSCTRLVLPAPHVRLQTATSLGAGASVSAGTHADGKGQHVMVLNIACGCGGCVEKGLVAHIFALRVRAEVQVRRMTKPSLAVKTQMPCSDG